MGIASWHAAVQLIQFPHQAQRCGTSAGSLLSILTRSKLGSYLVRPSCFLKTCKLSIHRAVHSPSDKHPNSRNDGYTAPRVTLPRSDRPSATDKDRGSGRRKGLIPWTFPQEMPRSVRHAQVTWKPNEGPFNAVWLRDCCPCDRCVDPSTTQKTFDTADISPAIHPKSVDFHDDGSVHISWTPDLPGFEDHVSVYDPSFGGKNQTLLSRLKATSNYPYEPILWKRDTMFQHQLSVDYNSYMHSSSALLSCLQHLHLWGLLFIHSIPSSSDAVTRLAERIGPLKNTFYGSTWDVKSVPSAKNVAYTSSHLGFHMVR